LLVDHLHAALSDDPRVNVEERPGSADPAISPATKPIFNLHAVEGYTHPQIGAEDTCIWRRHHCRSSQGFADYLIENKNGDSKTDTHSTKKKTLKKRGQAEDGGANVSRLLFLFKKKWRKELKEAGKKAYHFDTLPFPRFVDCGRHQLKKVVFHNR